jgi:hypothetical protein
MTEISRPLPGTQERLWTGPRLFAIVTVTAVILLFIGANAHLIAVSFASSPECVLQPPKEGVVVYRAAKPSC